MSEFTKIKHQRNEHMCPKCGGDLYNCEYRGKVLYTFCPTHGKIKWKWRMIPCVSFITTDKETNVISVEHQIPCLSCITMIVILNRDLSPKGTLAATSVKGRKIAVESIVAKGERIRVEYKTFIRIVR